MLLLLLLMLCYLLLFVYFLLNNFEGIVLGCLIRKDGVYGSNVFYVLMMLMFFYKDVF